MGHAQIWRHLANTTERTVAFATIRLLKHLLLTIVVYTKVKANANSSHATIASPTWDGTHVPYGITKCYLPPLRGDIPTLPQPMKVGT